MTTKLGVSLKRPPPINSEDQSLGGRRQPPDQPRADTTGFAVHSAGWLSIDPSPCHLPLIVFRHNRDWASNLALTIPTTPNLVAEP